jgi:hypothetical protein
MTISISNFSVNNTAPVGAIIGVLTAQDESGTTIPCSFTLTKNSAGFFAIAGSNLVTARAPILPGTYSVRVHANGIYLRFGSNAVFNIGVNVAAPPPPPPPLPSATYIISVGSNSVDGGGGWFGLVPAVALGATNAGQGQQWTWNGSTFANVYTAANPGGAVSGPYMADHGDGTVTQTSPGDTWTVSASGSGYTVRNKRTGLYLSIVANVLAMSSTQTAWTLSAPPSPTAITLSPASVTIPDNAPAGTLIATAAVTMSDGSTFSGTLTTSDTNYFSVSGLNIVTARAFTSADDGARSTVITASQGGQSLTRELSI